MDIKLSPLPAAVEGLKRNEAKVADAANEIVKATVETAPAPRDGGDSVAVSDEALVTDAVQGAAIPADGGADLTRPLVDLLQASTAYKANLFAVKVTADVEAASADLLKNRAVEA
ncbi:MAG: hypothetical protein H6922_03135 [Pseudomonadaceae bacterium]|nr:hypothetical protein [Pseudomonadaceae bacterium]